MADVKQIVCLANSRKLAGRCIAGREWTESGAGNWIRPVSKRDNQEVSEYERQYEDGSDPQVLDIVQVPVLEPKPDNFQTENWLLDDEYYWQKVGRLSQLELPKIVDPVEPLWADGYSTYNGRNDKIPLESAGEVVSSLRFIRVPRLKLSVFAPGEAFGNAKRRVQGQFDHAGSRYALWVSDPGYERTYLAKLNGTYDFGDEGGRVCYDRVAKTRDFRQGLGKVMNAAKKHRVALMCAEKEPLDCHRTLLVAQALDARGVSVHHILADGGLEDHAHAISRLVRQHDLSPEGDMFATREESISLAIAHHTEQVAFAAQRDSEQEVP